MTPIYFVGIFYFILSQVTLTSAFPMPMPMLPKITIRHDFQSLSTRTAAAQLIAHDGTHGKREDGGHDAKPLRKPRFYPYDPGNSTYSVGGIPESLPASFSTPFGSPMTTSFNSITFNPQPPPTSSTATTITDVYPPLSTSPNPLPIGFRTFPPTTALSIAPAPLPQPEPNLATESASSPVFPSTTTSSSPTFGDDPDCPFATRGQPQPSTESTSTPSFPVIVTVLPLPAESSPPV